MLLADGRPTKPPLGGNAHASLQGQEAHWSATAAAGPVSGACCGGPSEGHCTFTGILLGTPLNVTADPTTFVFDSKSRTIVFEFKNK